MHINEVVPGPSFYTTQVDFELGQVTFHGHLPNGLVSDHSKSFVNKIATSVFSNDVSNSEKCLSILPTQSLKTVFQFQRRKSVTD